MNNILNIKNLKKTYHDKNGETIAIDDISLKIMDKSFISIVGPSGCGKSTFLSILAGLENKSSGIIDANEDIKIGYMLQSDSLFPWRTVLDNCLLGLEINNMLNTDSKRRVISLLKAYGLYDFKDKFPKNLSGGMRQRVALIRTLAINPDILLLDEPFSALDYFTREQMQKELLKIHNKRNCPILFVTHSIDEALTLGDKIVVLEKGKIKSQYEIDEKNQVRDLLSDKYLNLKKQIMNDLKVL